MNQKEEKEAIDKAIKNFRGLVPTLETAIGAYFVGKKVGWKVLYLVHDKKTIEKYGKILGIDFRKELPEEGQWAHKSMAWEAMKKISNFWKAAKGEIPIEGRSEMK